MIETTRLKPIIIKSKRIIFFLNVVFHSDYDIISALNNLNSKVKLN